MKKIYLNFYIYFLHINYKNMLLILFLILLFLLVMQEPAFCVYSTREEMLAQDPRTAKFKSLSDFLDYEFIRFLDYPYPKGFPEKYKFYYDIDEIVKEKAKQERNETINKVFLIGVGVYLVAIVFLSAFGKLN